MNDKNKRKIILINRKFQIRMITKFIIVNSAILALFGFLCYIFFNSEIESNLHSAHVSYRNIRDMLFPIVITLSILNILISSILISIYVLYASFRLAGPMYRFNEICRSLGERNLSPVPGIREGDQFMECSNTLTAAVGTLSGDTSRIKEKIAELRELAGKNSQMDLISEKIKEIESIAGMYKV